MLCLLEIKIPDLWQKQAPTNYQKSSIAAIVTLKSRSKACVSYRNSFCCIFSTSILSAKVVLLDHAHRSLLLHEKLYITPLLLNGVLLAFLGNLIIVLRHICVKQVL